MPGTGERFGLKQDWWYDGRRDVIASTRAALDYLQYMHDEFFDDWLLAIAAYNCGEFRVQREVNANRAAGKPVDFFSLKPAGRDARLRAETHGHAPPGGESRGLRHRVQPDSQRALFRARRHRRPARSDAGGRARRHHASTKSTSSTRASIAGRRIRPARISCCCRAIPRMPSASNLELLSPDERVRVSLHTVKKGESVASIAKKYKTQAIVIRDMNSLENGDAAGGRRRAARADRRGQSTGQGDAGRGARRWTRRSLRPPSCRARGAQRRLAVAHRQAQSHGCRHAGTPERHGAGRHAACRPEAGAQHARCTIGQEVRRPRAARVR